MPLINLNILKNPLNWITVLLMLIIFTMFSDVVLKHYISLHDAVNPNPVANTQ